MILLSAVVTVALFILAFRALKRVGDASCVPALLDAAAEGNAEISQAAMESLESLQGKSVDDQLVARLSGARFWKIGLSFSPRTKAT